MTHHPPASGQDLPGGGARLLLSGGEALARAALALGRGPVIATPAPPLGELAAVAAREGGVVVRRDAEAAGLAYGAAAGGRIPLLAVAGAGLGRIGEVISAACASELPMVIAACTRGGPGGGNEAPTQTDYVLATRAPGPGGAAVPVLAPSSVPEAVALFAEALAWAERERTPVVLLLDALVVRTREGVRLPERVPPTPLEGPVFPGGPVLGAAPQAKEALEELGFRLFEKVRGWGGRGVAEEIATEDAELLLVAYGSTARIAKTAVEKARKRGIRLGLFRPVSLRPFPGELLAERLGAARGALVVELCEGQMLEDVRRLAPAGCRVSFYGRMGGAVPTPFELVHQVQALTGGAP